MESKDHRLAPPLWLLLALPMLSGLGCEGIMSGTTTGDASAMEDGSVAGDGAVASPPDGSATSDAGPDADAATVDAGPTCDPPPGPPAITGATHDVRPGDDLGEAMAAAASGDEIVVHAGSYGDVDVRDLAFDGLLVIRAADAESADFGSLWFERVHGVYVEGLSFSSTVTVQSGERVVFDGVSIDVGDIGGAAFHVRGRGGELGSKEITLRRSVVSGGARTLFLQSLFTPADEWNQDIVVEDNDVTCDAYGCVQISGSQHVRIEGNVFRDSQGDGVLLAGAIDVEVLRNRFVGIAGASGGAIRVASPGREWDDFDGVRYMVSEDVRIANNLVTDYGNGIELLACRRVDIVFNTVIGGRGLYTWRRTPHDRSGAEILVGNDDYRLWNNVLPEIAIDDGDPRPTLESHNAVLRGGAGEGLVTDDPGVDSEGALAAGSPLRDAALAHADNPADDLDGDLRVGTPDIGAIEDGAVAPCAP